MNQEYKCPYCGQSSYAKTSKKRGKYSSWKAVSMHTSRCLLNDNSYIICDIYGPLLISNLELLGANALKKQYPKLSLKSKLKNARKKSICTTDFSNYYTKQVILDLIRAFYEKHNKVPSTRDFKYDSNYPTPDTVAYHFGSWNNAIIAANLTPIIQNGFGKNTYGKDGNLYRSLAEAYFADNYLYNKYEYVIEPKYPKPYNRYYDWYIPSIDLYIELDGGCRPEIIEQKIKINESLSRICVVIPVECIQDSAYVKSLLRNNTV